MSRKTTELTITVLNQTKELLQKTRNESGLSYGEIIDRVILRVCPQDVELAHFLILDSILIAASNLDESCKMDVLYRVLQTLRESFSKDKPKEIWDLLELLTEQVLLKLPPHLKK